MQDLTLNGAACVEKDPVCEDLLLAILDELPSKNLLPLRGVSRLFLVLVDEVLRRRFLDIATSTTHELVLETSPAYDARDSKQEPLRFTHFVDPSSCVESITASFDVASETVHVLPLDEDEVFQNNLLGVHLQSLENPTLTTFSEYSRGGVRSFVAPYVPGVPPTTVPSRLSWSLSLASSLDRFFRDWFMIDHATSSVDNVGLAPAKVSPHDGIEESDDDVLSISPSSSRAASPPLATSPCSTAAPRRRLSRTQYFEPSNRSTTSRAFPSALKSALIECFHHPLNSPAVPSPSSTYSVAGSPSSPSPFGSSSSSSSSSFPCSGSTTPQVFEYAFNSVRLDVGKVVVAAEHGLKGDRKTGTLNPFVLFA
ncbi:hypothetical protein JCM10212_004677 [Sporobolomyces blumeae]